jgi:LysM repeat protein
MSDRLRRGSYLAVLIATSLLVLLFAQQVMAQDQSTEIELVGVLEQAGDGFIVVSGQTISIVSAEIKDPLTVGETVKVHYSIVSGQAVAREVERAADDDTPTTCTPTRPEGWITYVIQGNDTLSGIAARTGSSVEELVRVNCITNRRLIQPGTEIFVPLPIDDNTIAERCRLAGIEPERCRALFFGDDDQIAERCRLAGIEPERCRALFFGDDDNPAERCRLAGIEPERCRALLFGDDDNLGERCRLNEVEPERCRALLFGDDDRDNSGPGSINSGPGGHDDELSDDNSGSGSHDDDSNDDNSGRGRGGDDSQDDSHDDDNDDNGGGRGSNSHDG